MFPVHFLVGALSYSPSLNMPTTAISHMRSAHPPIPPNPLVCVLFHSRPPFSPHPPTDISVSLLAVVVGFCGLALLVVSLFVFWKLCWPIWRSKALSSHVDNCAQGALPEAPPPMTSLSQPAATETKVVLAGRQPSPQPPQKQREEEEKKRKVPEVKVNGRSSVKLLEAAMKISQTSPDIPAEVQQALHEHLTKQAKIQRQTTEPTSSSRYPFVSSTPNCSPSLFTPIAFTPSHNQLSKNSRDCLSHCLYDMRFSIGD